VGAYSEDPKKTLFAAEQAVGKLRRVAYDAVFESVGAFAVRGSTTIGKVKIAKLEVGNPLTAKVTTEGKYYRAGKDDAETFNAAFTGATVFRLYADKKVLMRKVLADNNPKERDFGFVTALLGAGANNLLMFEYLLAKPFAQNLSLFLCINFNYCEKSYWTLSDTLQNHSEITFDRKYIDDDINETLITNECVRQNMVNKILSSPIMSFLTSLIHPHLKIVVIIAVKNDARVSDRSPVLYINFEHYEWEFL
jgi:hypothetical protein